MSTLAWLKTRDSGAFMCATGVLFLTFLSTGLWSPQLSIYVGSLGANAAEIGLVTASFQISSLASQYWWGQRSDKIGRRKPLVLAGTAGLAVAYVWISLSASWQMLLVARLLEGVALAAYSTGSLALVGDLLEDQANRGRLMGLYRTFGSLAFSIAAFSGGWLADNLGARVPFIVAACCYLLALLLATQIRERPLEPVAAQEGEVGAESRLSARQRAALWPFLGLAFTWMFGMSAVVSLWPVYMESVGYTRTEVGRLWSLAALGEVPCLILAGYLADLWGRKRVLLTGLVSMAWVFLAYTISTAGPWIVGVQVFRSFAYSCFEAPALLYTTELGLRQQRGRLAGLFYSINGVGGISGALIGGTVATALGPPSVGLPLMYRGVVALMLVTALVVGYTMPRLRSVNGVASAD